LETLTVRPLALLLASLVVMAGTAHADDEDEAFVPFPRRSLAITGMAHGTRIGGQSESGFGPALELAVGRGRWQYIGEGSVASADRNDWTAPAADTRIDGRMLRGALGLRWLARQFRPDSGGGIELFLSSLLGLQRFYFDDGRLTRPELGLGFGIQARIYKRPKVAFRIDVRVLFTPNDNESELVSCRGRCMDEAGSSTGFLTGMGLAW
jgi:hypothetical protein